MYRGGTLPFVAILPLLAKPILTFSSVPNVRAQWYLYHALQDQLGPVRSDISLYHAPHSLLMCNLLYRNKNISTVQSTTEKEELCLRLLLDNNHRCICASVVILFTRCLSWGVTHRLTHSPRKAPTDSHGGIFDIGIRFATRCDKSSKRSFSHFKMQVCRHRGTNMFELQYPHRTLYQADDASNILQGNPCAGNDTYCYT